MRVTAERYLSLQEVGDELGVSDQTVRRWVKAGELAAYKPGKEYRIKGSDLEEFLKTREVSPKVQSPLPEADQEQREPLRDPWRAFVDRYLSRWEKAAETGAFDRGAAMEFEATLEDLSEAIGEMEGREISEGLPPSWPAWRLIDVLQAVSAAYEAKLEGTPLEERRERRKRHERLVARFESASGEENAQASG